MDEKKPAAPKTDGAGVPASDPQKTESQPTGSAPVASTDVFWDSMQRASRHARLLAGREST